MPEEKRAVIIGINEYEDKDIQNLEGAVNDAEDMHQRLTDLGHFKVADNHFLLNSQATCHAIRKAISDLLWQTDPCDLSLFYFSGHGIVDGRGNGYLAPCDMVKSEPFVNGIKMQELRQVLSGSVGKSSALIILDCCHSGISTKGGPDIEESLGNLADIEKEEIEKEEGVAKGKIILASTGTESKAREKADYKHESGNGPHAHGIFTFHLIEGLDGQAADKGEITLDRLRKYVDERCRTLEKQIPRIYIAQGSQLESIQIAITPQTYYEHINSDLDFASNMPKDDPASQIIAAVRIQDVLKRNKENEVALILRKEISDRFENMRQMACSWLDQNEMDAKEIAAQKDFSIQELYREFEKLVQQADFDSILKCSKRQKDLIILLFKAGMGDFEIDSFVERCKHQVKQPTPITEVHK